MKDPSVDVEFEICDATQKEFPDASFDVVYSRDTILHIEDKQALFAKFFRWLKPGGRVLISDYCQDCEEPDPEDENTSKAAANDAVPVPVPDAEAEADSAAMIVSIDPEPERNDAEPEPDRRTTVGAVVAGRGVLYFVTMAPDEPDALASNAKVAAATLSQAMVQ